MLTTKWLIQASFIILIGSSLVLRRPGSVNRRSPRIDATAHRRAPREGEQSDDAKPRFDTFVVVQNPVLFFPDVSVFLISSP